MVNSTKYGVISDIHQAPRIISYAIEKLKEQGVDKLLINGDIGQKQDTLEKSQNYIAFILNEIGKSNLESYIQPGSHETFLSYYPVLEAYQNNYSNLIDAIKNPFIDAKNHHLAFISGSDWNAGGEFTFGNDKNISTDNYINSDKGLINFFNINDYISLAERGVANGITHYKNINDLKEKVKDSEKTIVVCHVPRKFDNINNCVDMAYFAEQKNGGLIPGIVLENQIKNQFGNNISYEIMNEIALQNGFTFKRENRGNADLKKLYQELGITKAISGHFHESGHRANDNNGNHVLENTLTDELYWNSGHLDAGQTGILTVIGNKVSYQNINLFK